MAKMTTAIPRRFTAALLTLGLVLGFTSTAFVPVAAAESVQLRVAADELVTRGDFMRAVIKALNLEVDALDAGHLPYKRVPKALRPYIRVAHERGALAMFGTDLRLATAITRGEALQMAVTLGEFTSVGRSVTYKDVKAGSQAETAVAIAIENAWMQPLRTNLFGTRRRLQGQAANLFLRKLQGEHRPAVAPPRGRSELPATPRLQISPLTKTNSPLPKSQNIEALWNHIKQHYIDEDNIDPDEAYYQMAEALMKSLNDRYSVFMRPVQTRSFQTQLKGNVSGIGAQVEYIEGFLTIVSPLRGSPAEAAGLKPGDQILKVDEFDLVKIGFIEAVEKVRGPKGSTAKLRVRRNGIEFDVEVVRDNIKIPELSVSQHGDGYYIVKIDQFGRITQTELRGEIERLNAKNPKGVVLDLRKNPGGLLDAATSVLENFLPEGSTVAHINKRNSTREIKTDKAPVLGLAVPMVVLIDEGSASASEIVAASLQDNNRAKVVGMKSFGKGSVQQVLQFSDQSAFKLTIAKYLSPLKRVIDGVGVTPDKVVENSEQDDVQLKEALRQLRR